MGTPKPTWHPWIPADHFAPGGLADGLMGAWFALEGAGTLAHDLSRRGNHHGTLQGDAGWAAGEDGPVLDFPGGAGNNVLISDQDTLNPGAGDFSLFLKFRSTGNDGTWREIWTKWGAGPNNRAFLYDLATSGPPSPTIGTSAEGGSWLNLEYARIGNNAPLDDGAWHTMGFSRIGDLHTLYEDGKSVSSGTVTAEDVSGTADMRFSESGAGTTFPFIGQIAAALLYKGRALPAPDIRKLHADPYALLRPVRRWWAVALEVEAAGITHPVIGSGVVGSPVIRSNIT